MNPSGFTPRKQGTGVTPRQLEAEEWCASVPVLLGFDEPLRQPQAIGPGMVFLVVMIANRFCLLMGARSLTLKVPMERLRV
jgi:hypothetical protein